MVRIFVNTINYVINVLIAKESESVNITNAKFYVRNAMDPIFVLITNSPTIVSSAHQN
jgi:hypothetical protein